MHIGSNDSNDESSELSIEGIQLLYDIRLRKARILFEIQQLKDEVKNITLEIAKIANKEDDNKETVKEDPKIKQLIIGRKKFNMDPKKGEYIFF